MSDTDDYESGGLESDNDTELFDDTVILRDIDMMLTKYTSARDVEKIISEHYPSILDVSNFICEHSDELLDLSFDAKCIDVIMLVAETIGQHHDVIERLSSLILDKKWERKLTKKIFETQKVNKEIYVPGSYPRRYIEMVVRNNEPEALRWAIDNIEGIEVNYPIPVYHNLLSVLVCDVKGNNIEMFEILAPYFDLRSENYGRNTRQSLLKTMCEYKLSIEYFACFFRLVPDYVVKISELTMAVSNFDSHVCDLLHARVSCIHPNIDYVWLYTSVETPEALTWLLDRGYDPVAGQAFYSTCARRRGDSYLDILRERVDYSHLSEEKKQDCVNAAVRCDNLLVAKFLVSELRFPLDGMILQYALSHPIPESRALGSFLADYFDFSTAGMKFNIFYYDTMFYLLVVRRVNLKILNLHLNAVDYDRATEKTRLVLQWLNAPPKKCPVELECVLKWYPGRHLSFPETTKNKIRALLTLARAKSRRNVLSNISFDVLLHIFDWVSCAP